MIDPTGLAVAAIRDWPAVAAITTRVRGANLKDDDVPPAVVIKRLGVTRSPFGADTGRAGLQGVTLVATCYATTPQAASQLFGAVSDAVHRRRVPIDASGRLAHFMVFESGGSAVLEPDTKWSREDVVFNVTAAAQAVVP